MSNRELFAQTALPAASVKSVPLPEVGGAGCCCLRKLGADTWLSLRAQSGANPELGHNEFTYALLAATLCDESGTLLFAGAADLAAVFKLPLDTLERLAMASLEHSGLRVGEKN